MTLNLSSSAPLEALEAWSTDFLRERGYAVHKHGPAETPGALAKRLKVSVKHIGRRRRSPHCPEHAVETTATGRVLHYYSNPAFDAFITSHIH